MPSRHATLEYLTTAKIGEKGQLHGPKTIPQGPRFGNGGAFCGIALGGRPRSSARAAAFFSSPRTVGSALTGAGLTPDAILATLPEARKRLVAHRPKKSDSSKRTSRRHSRGQRREVTSQRRIRLFLNFECPHRGRCFTVGPRQRPRCRCVLRGSVELVLAEVVRDEVEENLFIHAERLPSLEADELMERSGRLISN